MRGSNLATKLMRRGGSGRAGELDRSDAARAGAATAAQEENPLH
jgi:hypothetical protein